MKKYLLLSVLAAAAISFTGCGGGGGGGGYVSPAPGPGPGPSLAVLYLDDFSLSGAPNVYYSCSSGDGFTDGDGAFYYYPGDACTFDLTGFDGSWTDPLYIDFSDSTGADGIQYDCWFAGGGYTDFNGEFIYDADDSCTFYF